MCKCCLACRAARRAASPSAPAQAAPQQPARSVMSDALSHQPSESPQQVGHAASPANAHNPSASCTRPCLQGQAGNGQGTTVARMGNHSSGHRHLAETHAWRRPDEEDNWSQHSTWATDCSVDQMLNADLWTQAADIVDHPPEYRKQVHVDG